MPGQTSLAESAIGSRFYRTSGRMAARTGVMAAVAFSRFAVGTPPCRKHTTAAP